MKIFIGSSGEAVKSNTLDKIALWIEEKGHQPLPWNTPGLFPPGSYALQELQNIAGEVGAACFIFSEDDKTWYRGNKVNQPRDNVILEYGLFVGRLDQRKAIIIRNGKPKKASDLDGVTYIDIEQERRAKRELFEWIESVEKSARIPSTKTITCHTNKYAMNDSNNYWSTLRKRANDTIIIVGDTNKSWISRDPVESTDFANQIIRLSLENKKSGLVSREFAKDLTMHFLRKSLLKQINSQDLKTRRKLKKSLGKMFTYSISDDLNYKAVLSDDKIILLPNVVTPEFREESMVLEIVKATYPVEYGYYIQDIRRIVEKYSRPDLIKEITDEIKV